MTDDQRTALLKAADAPAPGRLRRFERFWFGQRPLKDLAAKHKVIVGWLIRYAVDQLVEQGREAQLPLDFGRRI